ncbi:MAG: hypothetical protein K2K45_07565 [Muribaculaceae bacterium]|nr:hypothetical protein [Muribaculaceae bacterium]
MSNEISKGKAAMLPARMQGELLKISKSPKQYYAGLIPVKADEPLTDSTPTLSQIHRGLGTPLAMMAVSESLMDLKVWFNVKMNLNPDQIAMIAEMILEVHWDLSLNDLKGCFQKMMRTAKLYGKLDGSDILQWLDEYKQECITAKQKRLEEEDKQFKPSDKPITYEEWCAKTPKEKNYLANGRFGKAQPTDEERDRKEAEFQRFRRNYLKSKGIEPK